MNFIATKQAFTAIFGIFLCTHALAGFGGMGNVEANDAGSASFTSLLMGVAIMGACGYAAVKYASRFEGNQGYGRIAIGILVLLVLSAVFA